MKTKLIKFHFIILLILVVNIFVNNIFNFGLNSYAKIVLVLLLVGSGFSLFALNFKRLFKPFTLLKFYSTFFITIPIFVSFVWTSNENWSISVSTDVEEALLQDIPIYRQYDYEIYEMPDIFSFLNCNNGSLYRDYNNDYYIDKNYFIFKTRIGYFHSAQYVKSVNSEDSLNFHLFEISEYLTGDEIQSINVINDSISINFYEQNNKTFEINYFTRNK